MRERWRSRYNSSHTQRDQKDVGNGSRSDQGTPRISPDHRSRAAQSAHASIARWIFLGHLWLGTIITALLIVISNTGVLLNHKRGLGLMPDVRHQPTGEFAAALHMADLVRLAGEAAPAAAAAGVDRLDVRPRNGIMKVRFRDDDVTEVTLDVNKGNVLHVGLRNDVFLEKLHTGEISVTARSCSPISLASY